MTKKLPRLTKRRWLELAEAKAYDEQTARIRRRYGKRSADGANYGWGVSSTDTYLSVCTKVYGAGMVLTSTAAYPSLEIGHEWSEY